MDGSAVDIRCSVEPCDTAVHDLLLASTSTHWQTPMDDVEEEEQDTPATD